MVLKFKTLIKVETKCSQQCKTDMLGSTLISTQSNKFHPMSLFMSFYVIYECQVLK